MWRFLCERLAEEHQVHVPKGSGSSGQLPPRGVSVSWHELFLELYPLVRPDSLEETGERVGEHDDEENTFKIGVAARFRPAVSSYADGHAVVLPLHQQVQLVREKLGCQKQEALRMIMHERQQVLGLIPKGQKQNPVDSENLFQACAVPVDPKDKENVPLTSSGADFKSQSIKNADSERCDAEDDDINSDQKAQSGILAVKEDCATVLTLTRQSGLRDFTFDTVFGETARQDEVYDMSARRLVMEFLNGQSASLVCYGQTGSGKTFTMFSPPPSRGPLGVAIPPPHGLRGIVPRACQDILETVKSWRSRGCSANLGVSYVEIFGSEVSDLLQHGRVVGQGLEGRYSAVRATDRVGHRYVLDGNTECKVESWEEVSEVLRVGEEAKRSAATAMNERSTRAHTVFVMTLYRDGKQSRFYFADLGGSEKVSKSKADADTKAPVTVVGDVETRISWREYYEHRHRIQETSNINKGLFSLKCVIEALHQRSRLSRQGVAPHLLPYVPYQDSKLTMILKDALGGSARTMVLATATMDPQHADESLQTLRFAEMCSQVQKKQEESQAASVLLALGQIAEEIAQVEAAIVAKERWETRLIRRKDVDTVAGAFGEGTTWVREEVIPTSVLVGAEAERERLERLLKQQRHLEGLTGEIGRDYREMKADQATDGGKGTDFRENKRFSAKMKALDFENEIVLADAIRFLFRKAESAASAFGENEETTTRRLPRLKIPFGYFRLARVLKQQWEDSLASGVESRPFGKAMMDKCQEWSVRLKAHPEEREQALRALMTECGYQREAFDASPFAEVPEQVAVGSGELKRSSDSSDVVANYPDEF
jgi:kinesin family protein 5